MKLAVGFGSLLLVLVVIGGLSYYSLRRVVELSTEAAQKASAAIILRNIESRINDQKAEVRGFLLDSSRQEEWSAMQTTVAYSPMTSPSWSP